MEDFALDIVSFSLGLAIVVVLSVAVMRPSLRRPVARVRTPMVKPKPRPLPPPVVTPAAVVAVAASEPAAEAADEASAENAAMLAEDAAIEGSLEMVEGETIEQFRERLKKMSPPKKQSIDPEMLDLANSYDDKVAVTRMIATEDVSRVALVIKHMIQSDLNKDKK